jgi:hypothetical protein
LSGGHQVHGSLYRLVKPTTRLLLESCIENQDVYEHYQLKAYEKGKGPEIDLWTESRNRYDRPWVSYWRNTFAMSHK